MPASSEARPWSAVRRRGALFLRTEAFGAAAGSASAGALVRRNDSARPTTANPPATMKDQREAERGVESVLQRGEDLRADNAAGRPRGQHRAVHGRHQPGAEHVADERRHGAEAAAVAEQDPAGQDGKEPRVADDHEKREHHDARAQHDAEGLRPPDPVRDGSPEKSSGAVEKRADSNERCAEAGKGGGGREGVRLLPEALEERRLEADDRYPRGDVAEENHPQNGEPAREDGPRRGAR